MIWSLVGVNRAGLLAVVVVVVAAVAAPAVPWAKMPTAARIEIVTESTFSPYRSPLSFAAHGKEQQANRRFRHPNQPDLVVLNDKSIVSFQEHVKPDFVGFI
jgi:hypothetical protein